MNGFSEAEDFLSGARGSVMLKIWGDGAVSFGPPPNSWGCVSGTLKKEVAVVPSPLRGRVRVGVEILFVFS
jgi:hypothetical protein